MSHQTNSVDSSLLHFLDPRDWEPSSWPTKIQDLAKSIFKNGKHFIFSFSRGEVAVITVTVGALLAYESFSGSSRWMRRVAWGVVSLVARRVLIREYFSHLLPNTCRSD